MVLVVSNVHSFVVCYQDGVNTDLAGDKLQSELRVSRSAGRVMKRFTALNVLSMEISNENALNLVGTIESRFLMLWLK